MSQETLCLIWFLLEGALLAGYAVLDGFDLGVGILHPVVARTDRERRISMNSIGPIWDGNEVWLVTFGGALFAAFPEAYAGVFSGFYSAFMLLLAALISRAVSLEFRSKRENPRWRSFWDWSFWGGSFLATFLFGATVGNAVMGLPLDAEGNLYGTILGQLGPYPLLVGAMTVTLMALHGGLFLHLKTEGSLQRRLTTWLWRSWGAFLLLFMLTTIATIFYVPEATVNFRSHPWGAALVVIMLSAVANIPRSLYWGKVQQAFVSSAVTVVSLVGLFGMAMFPVLMRATDPAFSITVYNAASSTKTLTIMLVIAALGMPFVIGYTIVVYRTFRGKVRLDEHSY